MCPSAEGSVRDEDVSIGGRSLDLHADDMRHYVGIGTAREIDPQIMPDVSEGATDTEEYISLHTSAFWFERQSFYCDEKTADLTWGNSLRPFTRRSDSESLPMMWKITNPLLKNGATFGLFLLPYVRFIPDIYHTRVAQLRAADTL